MAAKTLTLFHAPCGQRLSRVRLSPTTGWQEALGLVGRDLEDRRCRCPRCKMAVRFVDVLPSVDDQGFQPLKTADEASLVGFGVAQTGDAGQKI